MVLVLVTAACSVTPQEQHATACAVICRCFASALPSAQDRCTEECQSELGISDDCATCVAQLSDRCAAIENSCAPVCQSQPDPDPIPEGRDAGFDDFSDAMN